MDAVEISTTHVPFADLHAQYLTIKPEIDAAIASVISQSAFIRGPFVEKFEQEFAEAIGVPHCVSCANGTDALYIAMVALGLKPGDEVIVPAMSWISTSETVTQAGAKIVFCDVDPSTYTIDVAKLADKVTHRTVGIIPVHLYGQPADMDGVMAVAAKHGLWVIEDCAQAHLATFKGRQVGTFGVAASFSFYPGKNLGAMGDAGAIVTSDKSLADRMAMFARHGGLVKGDHQIEGINSRLDGLQAAVLSVKLKRLAGWTDARRAIAAQYQHKLADLPGFDLPHIGNDRDPVWHLYVISHDRRDELAVFLKSRGIQTVINYPRGLPFLPCYAHLDGKPEDYPVVHRMQSRILSLPIFPEMTADQIEAVADALKAFA
ncbi:DegT/DnrJ/EryC1/StrS family aminotransferase [Mesorhizobium sp. M0815]|uniref:DegT/DnrJ/EryC1/StrS family aminotransferase n=1 Tax=Mesorhizobium sp. M0815 TaxID=2957005 RepID=UPI003337DE38